MKYRKLRIAWSVAWGVVAVLLIVVWVRSYSNKPSLGFRQISQSGVLNTVSMQGRLVISIYEAKSPLDVIQQGVTVPSPGSAFRVFRPWGNNWGVMTPYWFLVLVSAAFALLPWWRHLGVRYSLRTLLIATTVVAVALGLIVWVAK